MKNKIEVIKLKSAHTKGHMIRMNKDSALKFIQSLSTQIVENNPNTNRYETIDIDGNYFSISVHPNEGK